MTLLLYLLRQFALSFSFALGGTAFMVLPVVAVSAMHKLSGVGFGAILGYLPLVLVELVPYLVPMAFLLAVVATFGRLAAEREWTAISMAGIHPLRPLVPVVFVGVALSLTTYWILATLTPDWKYAQRAYRAEAIIEAFKSLRPGRTEFQVGDFYLKSENRVGNRFIDAVLELPTADGGFITLVADIVDLDIDDVSLVISFHNLLTVADDNEFFSGEITTRQPLADLMPSSTLPREHVKHLRSAELRELERDPNADEERRYMGRYELNRRYALSASYLVFLLLGVPTGLSMRTRTQLGAMAKAIGFAVLYYALSLEVGKEAAFAQVTRPEVAAWIANGIAGTLGAILLWRELRR